ncbi:MAG: NAD(P)H-dependent flavin oxidoreductase, partial [Acidimicrobiales bacterium]
MAGGAWLKERFGVAVRVVGAPMAGVAGGRLAGAISAAGGLGMIGVGPVTPPEWIEAECAVARTAGAPFGVGLMAWALETRPEQIDATIAGGPALVSVSFGDCGRFVGPLADAGIVTATQAGTVEQARAAESAGFDVVVARGAEAGGHGLNQIGTLPLLQSVLDAVTVPV